MLLTEIKHNKVMVFNHYLGIDISKKTLDAALIIKEGEIVGQTKVANNQQGFKELFSWAKKKGAKNVETLVCAEHTGIYGYDLQVWLDDNRLSFSFVPALEIKKSLGIRRGKNDSVDAVRIAEYAYLRRETITLSHKPSDSIFALKALLGERKQYVRTRASLLARKEALDKYESQESRVRRDNIIQMLTQNIQSLEKQMMQIIEADSAIHENYKLVTTIKGIGLVNAANTIVYTNNFTSFQTASMHPLLTRHLIGMIQDQTINQNHAQLIFTTHDTGLLDLKLLRRDQIWFAEKDQKTMQTDIYALTDFSPRKEENIARGYLQGRYGAIPFIGGGI